MSDSLFPETTAHPDLGYVLGLNLMCTGGDKAVSSGSDTSDTEGQRERERERERVAVSNLIKLLNVASKNSAEAKVAMAAKDH